MNLKYIEQSTVQYIEISTLLGRNNTMGNLSIFSINECAKICPERQSYNSKGKKCNRVSLWVFRMVALLSVLLSGSRIPNFAVATGSVENIYIQENVIKDGIKGIMIHTAISIQNMKNNPVEHSVEVWLDPDITGYSRYSDADYSKTLTPSYDNSQWKDLESFIPYSEFGANTGKWRLCIQVNLYDIALNKCIGTGQYWFNVDFPRHDIVDMSAHISQLNTIITTLNSKKNSCMSCRGKGRYPVMCGWCRGLGRIRTGYNPPLYANCPSCHGTGKETKQCMACRQIDISLNASQATLEWAKKANGMTKDEFDIFCKMELERAQGDNKWLQTINSMCMEVLRNTNYKHSSASNTCSNCHGTGYDPTPFDNIVGMDVGGYSHTSQGKCFICGKYGFHQHPYCPRCMSNKYGSLY